MTIFKQRYAIPKNHKIEITIPGDIPENEIIEIQINYPSTKRKQKISELHDAIHDPLFKDDLSTIQEEFSVVDQETW